MSLKDFHIVFIIAAIILSIGFGVWALNNYGQPSTPALRATAAGSFTAAVALSIYCVSFIRKMKVKN